MKRIACLCLAAAYFCLTTGCEPSSKPPSPSDMLRPAGAHDHDQEGHDHDHDHDHNHDHSHDHDRDAKKPAASKPDSVDETKNQPASPEGDK